jgi:hypothetical protein
VRNAWACLFRCAEARCAQASQHCEAQSERIAMKASTKRRPTNTSVLPTEPGLYTWSEWPRQPLSVYAKRGSPHLYVMPPRGMEVRITPFIVGTFKKEF